MNVVTVLWQSPDKKPWAYCTRPADRPKPEEAEMRFYTASEVIRFERMVKRFLPHANFYCLTNVDIPGVQCIPLVTDLKAWWAKMEMFRPDLPDGRTLYFDLDTLLVRDIRVLSKVAGGFLCIQPTKLVGSNKPSEPWQDHEGFWRYPRYQTSVMMFDRAYVQKFWDAFDPVEHPKHYASDQDFIGDRFRDEKTFPKEWFGKIKFFTTFPPKPVKVVLTIQMQNDGAARRYPWVDGIWEAA